MRRELPGTESLSASPVNAKYGEAVVRACDQHFATIVPLRAGKDNLYTYPLAQCLRHDRHVLVLRQTM